MVSDHYRCRRPCACICGACDNSLVLVWLHHVWMQDSVFVKGGSAGGERETGPLCAPVQKCAAAATSARLLYPCPCRVVRQGRVLCESCTSSGNGTSGWEGGFFFGAGTDYFTRRPALGCLVLDGRRPHPTRVHTHQGSYVPALPKWQAHPTTTAGTIRTAVHRGTVKR